MLGVALLQWGNDVHKVCFSALISTPNRNRASRPTVLRLSRCCRVHYLVFTRLLLIHSCRVVVAGELCAVSVRCAIPARLQQSAAMSALLSPKPAQLSTPTASGDSTTSAHSRGIIDRTRLSRYIIALCQWLTVHVVVCVCSVAPVASPAGLPASPSKASKRVVEAERRKADQMSAEVVRAVSLASARWSDCLLCLSSSLPLLQDNPYLLILQPPFLYDYLDSLTETLANLSSHNDDLQHVRSLLQRVYGSFIELGKFAKYQPAFYFDDPGSIKRFIRLMEQVSHRASDKALYPNILSLLTPTFSRVELYPMLQQHHILRCLLSFAANSWSPNQQTGAMLLAIIEEMTADEAMRAAIQREQAWERLCKLCWGREHGLTKELQQRGQQALQWAEADMPEDWRLGQDDDDEGPEDGNEDSSDLNSSSGSMDGTSEERLFSGSGGGSGSGSAAPPSLDTSSSSADISDLVANNELSAIEASAATV